MKFLCPNCKAKYQISDEKIAGRTLKMDCRRCNHPIVIRGNAPEAMEALAEQEPKPAAPATSRPGAAAAPARRTGSSHVGPAPARSSRSALGADFRKPGAAPAAPARPSALDQWHVAINDVPVGPMRREEVAKKIAAGAVTPDSLTWREGFDDWRPLRDVAELAALLRKAAPPPPAGAPIPRGAIPAAPPAAQPRPARPPTGRVQTASPVPAERPAARGNVVPIGGRLGAAAAPALDELEDEGFVDDEPTRVGSAIDFAAMDGEARAEEERVRGEADRARRSEEERARRDEETRKEEEARLRQAEEQRKAAAAPIKGEVRDEDAFDPFGLGPAASSAGSLGAGLGAAAPSSPGLATPAPIAAAFAAPPPQTASAAYAPPPRRGLPVGAWIAIAGATAFGVVLAIMVGTKLILTPPAPAVAATLPTPSSPTQEPRTAELDLDPAPPEPAAPEPPTPAAPEVAQEGPARPPRAGNGNSNSSGSGSGNQGSTNQAGGAPTAAAQAPRLSAEDQARLDRLAADDDGQGAAPLAINRPNSILAEERRPTGEGLNEDQLRTVVLRERSGVERCYQTAIRQIGRAPTMRLDVDVTIGSTGTVTSARARGQDLAGITECVERSVRRWRFPVSGGVTQTSIPFVFQGTE